MIIGILVLGIVIGSVTSVVIGIMILKRKELMKLPKEIEEEMMREIQGEELVQL